MDKNTNLIYEGQYHRVEWYYDEKGHSQPYEYFVKSNSNQKRKFLILIKKMADFGVIFDKTKFRNEGEGIYAFKPQPDRYLPGSGPFPTASSGQRGRGGAGYSWRGIHFPPA